MVRMGRMEGGTNDLGGYSMSETGRHFEKFEVYRLAQVLATPITDMSNQKLPHVPLFAY
jgi:hypothetical protein